MLFSLGRQFYRSTLCRWYERVYLFLPSVLVDTRREAQFIKAYVNYTILPPPQRTAHLVMSKISTLLVEIQTVLLWSDPKNPTTRFNGRTLTDRLFKILKFSGLSLPGRTSTTHSIHSNSPISCLGVYYDRWWLSYPFHAGVRVLNLTKAPELRNTE